MDVIVSRKAGAIPVDLQNIGLVQQNMQNNTLPKNDVIKVSFIAI